MSVIKTDIYLETFEINIFFQEKENVYYYDTDDIIRSEVCVNDAFSQNEIKITNVLKNMSQYYLYFNVFVEYHSVKLGQLNDKNIESMDYYDDNNILFIYHDKHKISFSSFITSFKNCRQFLLNLLESYCELIKIFCITHNTNLCIFNVSPENILFDETFKPQLSNFKKSFTINSNNVNLYEHLKNEDYVHKPLELHLLYYLLNNEDFKLNDEIIDDISTKFIDEIKIFENFSTTFKIEYKYKLVAFLKQFLNKSNSEIISDILQYANTWDNYSISVIYLHIVSKFIKFFSIREGFLSRFFHLLTKNIDPNPLKRPNIYKTLEDYENLFTSYINWDFVSDISDDKLKDYYELLYR